MDELRGRAEIDAPAAVTSGRAVRVVYKRSEPTPHNAGDRPFG